MAISKKKAGAFTNEFASLTITDVEDGTCIVITSPMAEANLKGAHPIQNMGAVETYQRRYLWMAAMEIVEHDVIDALGDEAPAKPKASKPVAQPETKSESKAAAPTNMEGREGPWQLKISADPGYEVEEWISLLEKATMTQLGFAESKSDVMNIFKMNRNIFDRMKLENESRYKKLMEEFTKTQEKFKEPA